MAAPDFPAPQALPQAPAPPAHPAAEPQPGAEPGAHLPPPPPLGFTWGGKRLRTGGAEIRAASSTAPDGGPGEPAPAGSHPSPLASSGRQESQATSAAQQPVKEEAAGEGDGGDVAMPDADEPAGGEPQEGPLKQEDPAQPKQEAEPESVTAASPTAPPAAVAAVAAAAGSPGAADPDDGIRRSKRARRAVEVRAPALCFTARLWLHSGFSAGWGWPALRRGLLGSAAAQHMGETAAAGWGTCTLPRFLNCAAATPATQHHFRAAPPGVHLPPSRTRTSLERM